MVRYYVRDKHHRLRNAPYVDNSCKWAGGGFVSNVHDLVRFGNAMLYSFQHAEVQIVDCIAISSPEVKFYFEFLVDRSKCRQSTY